ncbi:MAG: nickel pincer cofactor biosynthesis protein LarC [Candidatus Margulisiibacteriota bacterium]
MKIAYFDCPTGISGNMILGALLDAGLDKTYLLAELQKLQTSNFKLPNKAQIIISKTKKRGLAGTYFNVNFKKNDRPRNLADILKIIKRSKLSAPVKKLSGQIFRRLAQAEAKVHGLPVNKVHFHEVGAVDAIIDIVGACLGLEKLGIEKVYCSPLPAGQGKIAHAHGILPNPAPATAELLKGAPTYSTGLKGELVTPTGAAIITAIAEFAEMPKLKVENIGYGAGSLDLSRPNLLRVFIGEALPPTEHDAILQIEANIDDMDPRHYDRAIARLMKAGALDASVQPIRMKKQRAAVKLEVLCLPEKKERLLDAVFTETTTIGTRVYLVKREKLRREIRGGNKISYFGPQVKRIKPE